MNNPSYQILASLQALPSLNNAFYEAGITVSMSDYYGIVVPPNMSNATQIEIEQAILNITLDPLFQANIAANYGLIGRTPFDSSSPPYSTYLSDYIASVESFYNSLGSGTTGSTTNSLLVVVQPNPDKELKLGLGLGLGLGGGMAIGLIFIAVVIYIKYVKDRRT